jgi:MFS family permease
MLSALGVVFGLEETLEALRDRPDYPLRFSRWVGRTIFRIKGGTEGYVSVEEHEFQGDEEVEEDVERSAPVRVKERRPRTRRKLSFRRIWTPNVLLILLSHGLLAMHVGTFNNLWFVFLSTPRYDPQNHRHSHHTIRSAAAEQHSEPLKDLPPNYKPHLPFTFTGGLALPPPSIGTALAILGVIGISLQLLLYPRLSFRLGTVNSYRYSILLFPLSYFLAPYLAVLPSSTAPPGQASGFLVWMGITLVLCIQVLARTFALPAAAILVNNSSPHPSVLGTLHGIAQSVSSATRTAGPVLAGWAYGVGLSKGVVGLAWWCMAGIAVLGAIAGRFVWEGDGHEIWLEGEREELEGKGRDGGDRR